MKKATTHGIGTSISTWDLYVLIVVLASVAYATFLVTPFTWLALPLASIILFLVQQRKPNSRNRTAFCIGVGIFLAFFDLVFENVGSYSVFWVSSQSVFRVSAAPLEVIVACVFGGAAWAMFSLSVRNDSLKGETKPLLSSFGLIVLDTAFFAIGGTLAEQFLVLAGAMRYSNGWSWPHALISYLTTWLVLNIILETLGKDRLQDS